MQPRFKTGAAGRLTPLLLSQIPLEKPMKHSRIRRRRFLGCERLESRCLLSALASVDGEFHAIIVAGDPKGNPKDSPALRVDPNTLESPFAGVGSLRISAASVTYICTATPISRTHVLTAGHCLDIDNNGQADVSSATFILNAGGEMTSQILADHWDIHPDYTGFSRPSVNDDLALITLSEPVPDNVPIYSLATTDMFAGQTRLTMVGYGRSGDGVRGYSTGASYTVKRDGQNMVDAFYGQDDAGHPAAKEVFRFDFDGPKPNTNLMGDRTLGNDVETTLGGGDSGGPSFVLVGGTYYLAGVNTFTQGATAPKFGSLGGGINVFAYRDWIAGVQSAGDAPLGDGSLVSAESSQGTAILELFISEEFAGAVAASDHAFDTLHGAARGGESGSVFVLAPAHESFSRPGLDSRSTGRRTFLFDDETNAFGTQQNEQAEADWDCQAVDFLHENALV